MELIAQGAEARIYRDGRTVIKDRIAKSYRHPDIDTGLRGIRTRREAKILDTLARIGFPSPRCLSMDDIAGKLVIEHLEGPKLRDVLDQNPGTYGMTAGRLLAMMHNIGVIHGDPTTSNMIVKDGAVNFIDFGLSQISTKIEDKAVDLHLLDRAIESAHHRIHEQVMKSVLDGYCEIARDASSVLSRLETVRKRGRNKNKGS